MTIAGRLAGLGGGSSEVGGPRALGAGKAALALCALGSGFEGWYCQVRVLLALKWLLRTLRSERLYLCDFCEEGSDTDKACRDGYPSRECAAHAAGNFVSSH